MRPLLAIVLTATILLGVRSYLQFAAALRRPPAVRTQAPDAAGVFSVEITLTFDAEADEFSLESTALVLRQQDNILLQRDARVPAGTPIVIDNITGIVAGRNEFYFECVPRADGEQVARAVRVRVLRDGLPVADETLWAAPGQVPRGQIALDIPDQSQANTKAEHDHLS